MKKTRAEKIRSFILEKVEGHPSDIVNLTMEKFSVSRTTVHRHLNTLIKQNRIGKTGHTQATQYYRQESFNQRFDCPLGEDLQESEVWEKHLQNVFKRLPANIYDICVYGFTEVFNNAIDHSGGKVVSVQTKKEADAVSITIWDDGIGAFQKIKDHFQLGDIREAVFQLTKGKLTTDPANHTGEGLFFSSRAFDEFDLYANGVLYSRDNTQEDWYLEDRDQTDGPGTIVRLKISENSERDLDKIFEAYQNKESMAFDKTHIVVRFSQMPDEKFISRSQAKRVLRGLEKFRRVTLDFKGVKGLGQGFVDEVFRVFPTRHPDIHFESINANKSVQMMIDRAKATRELDRSAPTIE